MLLNITRYFVQLLPFGYLFMNIILLCSFLTAWASSARGLEDFCWEHHCLKQPHWWVDGLPWECLYHWSVWAAVWLLPQIQTSYSYVCFKLVAHPPYFVYFPLFRTKAVFFVLIIYYWNFEDNKLSCVSHTCITPDMNKSNEQVTHFIETVFGLYIFNLL